MTAGRLRRLLASSVLALLATIALPRAQAAAPSSTTIAFTHVSVIDTTGGATRSGMTVIVTAERIAFVGRDDRASIPAGSTVVDSSGQFIIPGLWDMHVHTFFGDDLGQSANDVILPLFIANGVTGVRDMGSDLAHIVSASRDIAAHRLLGPRMVFAGPMLDGPKTTYPASIAIKSEADGRRAVDELAAAGVNFIKVQSNVPRDAYFAIAERSRKLQLPFAGHVPDAIRASEAVGAGQYSFEHLIGIFEASSTAETELLKGPKSPGIFLETFDAAHEAGIIKLLAKHHVWQCPTLFWERGQWLVDSVDPAQDADTVYAPATWKSKEWPQWKASILKSLDTDPLAVREHFVEHELGIVKRLKAAGVPFLAGTDTPAGVGVMPGFSLHRELERFVAAGFSPLEALQTATINPAKYLNRVKDYGSVERGKVADLVLLGADPTVAITNTRTIVGVVAAGRYLPRVDIDRMLTSILAASAAPAKKAPGLEARPSAGDQQAPAR